MIPKAWKAYQQERTATYLLLILHVLFLLGLSAGVAVAIVQPEDGMDWDAPSGQVTEITAGGPAARAGLHVGDQILAVDGLLPTALPSATGGKRAGETLSLTVYGDGEAQSVSLTLERPPASILLDRMIPMGIGLGFGIIGLATYLLSQRQPPAALFVLVCLAVTGALVAGTLSTFKIPFASHLFSISLVWVAALSLHFHTRFPQIRDRPVVRRVLGSAYTLAGLVSIFFLLPGWATWRWQPWYPGLQWGLRLVLGLSLVVQIVLLATIVRGNYPRARRHARLLIAGAVLGLAPFLLLALLPDLLTGQHWWPYQYTFPFLLIMPLAYGYTLVRARLSHWDRAVARLLAAFSVAILLASAYGLAVRRLEPDLPPWLPVVLALGAGLALWPLARAARRWTDRVLFDVHYDYAGIVSALGEQLAHTLDRPTLRRLLVERLPELMPFEGAALLLAREDDEEGALHLEPPSTLVVEAHTALPGEGTLARALTRRRDPIAAVSLRSLLAGGSQCPAETAWLSSAAVETWLPLAREGELLGVLLLGPRLGGDLLDGQDRRILRSVAHQAALAAENVRLADALRGSRAELAHAHGQLLLAREEERRQLGWSLHDGPIQDLLVISLRLAALGAESGEHAPEMAALRQAVVEQVNVLRRLYARLRPGTLDELGLREALRALAIEYEDDYGLTVAFHAQGEVEHLSDEAAVTLFRAAQEALTNVSRHSGTERAWLAITRKEEGIALTVADEGRGFRVPRRLSALAYGGHFGLLGMAERLERLGGRLEVRSQPGEGTTVQVWLPVEAQEEGTP
ncbi:MAG: PDZ domain-containing protein [Anaerolineae bacterium]|nr:PDZ domain-containing protein [Anaerolineae bacterium]